MCATLTLMSKLPPEAIMELDDNGDISKDADSMLEYFGKHVPNMDEVIQLAFKEGMESYQEGLKQSE